jgi:microcystin-dependent protein
MAFDFTGIILSNILSNDLAKQVTSSSSAQQYWQTVSSDFLNYIQNYFPSTYPSDTLSVTNNIYCGGSYYGDGSKLSNTNLLPVGTILLYSGNTMPTADWMVCDGSLVSRTTYAALYTVIGTTYGVGDGSTTFNLPDFRESAPVGAGVWSAQTGQTTHTIAAHDSYTLGQFNDDQGQLHIHTFTTTGGGTGGPPFTYTQGGENNAGSPSTQNVTAPVTDGTHGTPRTGYTTHGKQLGINYIIKVTNSGATVPVITSVSSGVIQPIVSNIGTNTTYTMPNVAGNYCIYIPASLLVSTGSACTLYISSGTGAQIAIPISASGATGLVSLYLPFYIDTSGNCVASGQELTSGSNSNGYYIQFANGTMIAWYDDPVQYTNSGTGVYGGLANTSIPTYTFPIAFIGAIPTVIPWSYDTATGYSFAAFYGPTTLSQCIITGILNVSGHKSYQGYQAIGRWK